MDLKSNLLILKEIEHLSNSFLSNLKIYKHLYFTYVKNTGFNVKFCSKMFIGIVVMLSFTELHDLSVLLTSLLPCPTSSEKFALSHKVHDNYVFLIIS